MKEGAQGYPWEKTVNGIPANLPPRYKSFHKKDSYAKAMGIAMYKVYGVLGGAATFEGDKINFERYFQVFLTYSLASTEFLGVYRRSDWDQLEEAERRSTPYYYVRIASWNQEQEVERYQQAPDKQAYIFGETQIESHNRFVAFAQYPYLEEVITQGSALLQAGVMLQITNREPFFFRRVQVQLYQLEYMLQCDYFARVIENKEVEMWLVKWRDALRMMKDEEGIVPEGGFEVTYMHELQEAIHEFTC